MIFFAIKQKPQAPSSMADYNAKNAKYRTRVHKPLEMGKQLKISQIFSVFFQWVYFTSQNLQKVQTCSQKFAEGKRNWDYIVWDYNRPQQAPDWLLITVILP